MRRATPTNDPDRARQREAVDAFRAAAANGDFDTLVAVLDPDVVLRSDGGALRPAASVVVRGAPAVAKQALKFAALAPLSRPALVNGAAGEVVASHGKPFAILAFTVSRGKIVEFYVFVDPALLRRLDPEALGN